MRIRHGKGRKARLVPIHPEFQAGWLLGWATKKSTRETASSSGQLRRTADAAEKAHQQAVRQRWRVLALIVKAKLEATETGIITFEEEFLSYIVLPDNSTVGEYMLPQIESAYQNGEMPRMLPGRP